MAHDREIVVTTVVKLAAGSGRVKGAKLDWIGHAATKAIEEVLEYHLSGQYVSASTTIEKFYRAGAIKYVIKAPLRILRRKAS